MSRMTPKFWPEQLKEKFPVNQRRLHEEQVEEGGSQVFRLDRLRSMCLLDVQVGS